MLAFRSEEHLATWLASGRNPRGEAMPLDRQWLLAQRWFAGRHKPDWKKRREAEIEDLFRSVGLTSDFWKLT